MGRRGEETSDVAQGRRASGISDQIDRVCDDAFFTDAEVTVEYDRKERRDDLRSAVGGTRARFASSERGVERVHAVRAAGCEGHDVEREALGEWCPLTFGVDHRNEPRRTLGRFDRRGAPDERLRDRALPVSAGSRDDEVRRGDETRVVGRKRVEEESSAAGQEISSQEWAGCGESALDAERIDRGEMRGRCGVARQRQAAGTPLAHVTSPALIPRSGVRPMGRVHAHAASWRRSSARSSSPHCAALSTIVRAEVSSAACSFAVTVRSAR